MKKLTRQGASLLLCYPDDEALGRLPLIAAAVPRLASFARYATDTPPMELRAHYVETFDMRRKCCLFLTYYTDGDTRRRGASLAELKAIYRSAGWELRPGELPDFLPAVLEFAALGNEAAGERILAAHRAGIELLRVALHDRGSPYAHVVDAICETLPPAVPGEAGRLAAAGPPHETVGVYG